MAMKYGLGVTCAPQKLAGGGGRVGLFCSARLRGRRGSENKVTLHCSGAQNALLFMQSAPAVVFDVETVSKRKATSYPLLSVLSQLSHFYAATHLRNCEPWMENR